MNETPSCSTWEEKTSSLLLSCFSGRVFQNFERKWLIVACFPWSRLCCISLFVDTFSAFIIYFSSISLHLRPNLRSDSHLLSLWRQIPPCCLCFRVSVSLKWHLVVRSQIAVLENYGGLEVKSWKPAFDCPFWATVETRGAQFNLIKTQPLWASGYLYMNENTVMIMI